MTSYPVPGRGAWTTLGGLLTAKPGTTSHVGYYRLNASGETPIGSAWITKADTSHHAQVVQLGTRALQGLVGVPVREKDGWFGPDTDQYLRAAQSVLMVEVDGIVGRATMRAALSATVEHHATQAAVPMAYLGGLLVNESGLDPAAVGVNGTDHGLAQINLASHPEISLLDAMDPDFAIGWTATELAHTWAVWNGQTARGVDPWDIAIANHNSPALARSWALSGQPPVVAKRPFQIADYVAKVKTDW